MHDVETTAPRAMALQIASHAGDLEGRLAFAEAILPLVEKYRDAAHALGIVTGMLPRFLPAQQWLALAQDHLHFLIPELGGVAGVRRDVTSATYRSNGTTPAA